MEPDKQTIELRLRAAVESSPSGLLMIDPNGLIVLVNREVERLFGYPREDLLGRPVEMLVPERVRGKHPGFRADFLKDPQVRAMGAGRDLFGLRKDGTEVPVEIGLTPVATAEGMFVISSVVDISARKRSEALFRAAVEASPAGALMVDSDGRIVLVNQEVERMFGYDREELLGQSIEKLVPGRFRSQHPGYRQGFFAAPSKRAMGAGRDLYGLRKDGTEIPVEIGLNPIENDEGNFVLCSVVDITRRRQEEERRQRLEEQLRQAQKMEALGTLAGGIAHDFNNILAVIQGYAELAREAVRDHPTAAPDLEELLKAAVRGKELIERILRFGRRQESVRQPLSLGQVVADASHLLRASLPVSIQMDVRIAPDAPRVLADSTAVQQILMNLATNAAYAMPAGGSLEILVTPTYVRDSVARSHPDLREGPYLLLTVRDTGEGMDEATKERVFEPFFTTKPPGSGSGLGLPMVHGMMRDHEGAVLLDSVMGVGTTVRCFFPVFLGEEPARARVAFPAPPGHGERILFVEDEPSLAEANRRRLVALDYRVATATSPQTALDLFQADPDAFDVVVTDYSMPEMTGLELAGAMLELRPHLPIILLSGMGLALSQEAVDAVGIRQVLTKPVSSAELSEAIQSVLSRGRINPVLSRGRTNPAPTA